MDQFDSARNIAHVLLQQYDRKDITKGIIDKEIENIFLMSGFEGLDREKLISQLEADFEVYSKEATLLVAEDVKPWLYDEKSKINPELWNRYRIYMNQKDSSFPIDTLDDITDKILDKCVNPKTKGSWDRRGMVVGNVQSGKTANYTGLINKATDAGYKLIIVIAGIHNSLRAQTQLRIDEGYIGRNSSDFILRKQKHKIGVGKIKAETEIYSFTSSDSKGDFNRPIATSINVPIGGQSPTVLVIKKNKSILENLILWLYQFSKESERGDKKIFNVPLLLIDDEADNASVNSGTELDVKTINRLIRTLLNLFNQNTFIGYTATPYANIFIPSSWSENLETMVKDIQLKVGEDLFPRDFIVNIPPPSNYIGAVQVFGFENNDTGEEYDGLDIVRLTNDQEPYFPKKLNSSNKEELPDDVPSSLKTAIKSFILTCAIRRLRGQGNKHNSMLVHVALYVAWIDRVAWLINEIIRDYNLQIKSGQGNLLNELQELYEMDFNPTTENVLDNISYNDPKIKKHIWEEVKQVLIEAVSKIEVRSVHGTKNTRKLEYHNIEDINYNAYDNGISVIAVGGNRLARGITLEGLSVSYYLRTTRLYDSLMQMGRWFGYRPGYVDLCRLYTTDQLINWYRHITLATEEMRADFDDMAAQNKRPADYRLKVRTHSGLLNITGAGKMREHEKIQVGFSGKMMQTYQLIKNEEIVRSNFRALNNLLERLENPVERLTSTNKLNGLTWVNIEPNKIMDFLSEYTSDLPNIRPDIINSYIRKQNSNGLLTKWTIAVILNSETKITYDFKCKDRTIKGGLPYRKNVPPDCKDYFTLSKNNIFDRKDRRLDLNITKNNPKESIVRTERAKSGKSLLVIYPLDWTREKDLPENTPLVGWGLIFPDIENEEKVEFAARPLISDAEETQNDDDVSQDE
ncbi:Z1 domain-containing protein [Aquimarina algiphila]|uniref:Z1 domain-containing protein n=1 Tax=Aquimarina algiphila TaxID=2047982 RepID=UPI00232D9D8E|nr:Z1 domain-containing protein [Aquimarina algiphila]